MNSVLNWPGHGIFALSARLYLGVVFIMASIHKILDPGSFAVDVATYEILPQQLINLMAICLPYIEITAGVLLVLGVKSRAGAWLVTGMMIMFMAALAIALHNGLDMSCGCFASSAMTEGDEISIRTIFRDSVWLFLAVYVLVFDLKPIGLVTIVQKLNKGKA